MHSTTKSTFSFNFAENSSYLLWTKLNIDSETDLRLCLASFRLASELSTAIIEKLLELLLDNFSKIKLVIPPLPQPKSTIFWLDLISRELINSLFTLL